MKLRTACALFGFLSLLQLTIAQTPAQTASALPRLVRFGGTVKDLNGTPLTGVVGITFAFYSEETGGAPLWLETQNATADSNGHYSVLLGSTKPEGLPAELFTSEQARWVGVQVSGQPEQSRTLLVSAPYALKAGDAETIGGLPPSAFVLAAPPISGSATASSSCTTAATESVSPATTSDVTTTGGTADAIPLFSTATNIQNSILTQTGTTAVNVGGKLNLPATAAATKTAGADSRILEFVASSFSSTSSAAVNQNFQWRAEPAANDTASPSGTLNLLYSLGTAVPTETGLELSSKGIFTFATGQTFPGADITGTISASGYDIGGVLFATGSAANQNAYLGFAGNTSSTGGDDTGTGFHALSSNTTGYDNTASGAGALSSNTTGFENTALGYHAGPDSSALADSTAIGANATVSQGNSLVLGQTTSGSPGASYVNVGIGTATPRSTLEAVVEEFGAVAPVLTLTNSGGSAEVAIDFNTYLPSTTGNYNPSARIFAADNGDYADYLYFASNASGAPNNGELNTMQIAPNGDVYAYGTLSSGSADSKIDHPLDPANKFLIHSSVESSEMVNIYSGNIVTDELGLATVKLPDWFEAENADFRYQLTTIGRDAHAWIAKKVQNDSFQIATNATNVEVSWQITGVRQDAYAKAHPLVVEQDKPAIERGHYAHPELYGQSVDKQIGSHAHDRPASAVDKHFPTPPATALDHPLPRGPRNP